MIQISEKLSKLSLEHILRFRIGGDHISSLLLERFYNLTGIMPLVGYGSTETLVVMINNNECQQTLGSMGNPVEGVEIKLIDQSGNLVIKPNSPGEIVLKTPNMMQGYWNKGELDVSTFNDGWFATGDIALRSECGSLWFQGRKTHMMVINGRNVYPLEIENVLNNHPAVKCSVVIGVHSSTDSEIIIAFVTLISNKGRSNITDELDVFLRKYLSERKLPSEYVFLEDMPLVSQGKVDRDALLNSFIALNSNK